MNFKKFSTITFMMLLLGRGTMTTQAAGVEMEGIEIGDGITVFFHPETDEFSGFQFSSDLELAEVDALALQEIEALFGEDSKRFQSLQAIILEDDPIEAYNMNPSEELSIAEASTQGIEIEGISIGNGITVFFHPETNEFSGFQFPSDLELDEVDTLALQEIKNLFGEESVEFQSLQKNIEENPVEPFLGRSTLSLNNWVVSPRSTRTDSQRITTESANSGIIRVNITLSTSPRSFEPEARSNFTVRLVQQNGTSVGGSFSGSSFNDDFGRLPRGSWSLRITNNTSVAQFVNGTYRRISN